MTTQNLAPHLIKPAQELDSLAAFIREHLVCDDHQLTILSLWTTYTWCFTSFLAAPYLDIRSPEPQSGKTACLYLLDSLCCNAVIMSGAASSTLFPRLLLGRSTDEIKKGERPQIPLTILFDDCHHSFGPSERQPLLALLNCGSDAPCLFPFRGRNYSVYGPKAFAGQFPLPRSLASRCIPIVLRRKKSSDTAKPFIPDDLLAPSANFREWLEDWARENHTRLEELRGTPIQFPPALSPRQQQCAEPLLRIANLMGGSWPARARAALASVFSAAECSDQVQLLRDVRTLFFQSSKPEEMLTRDLLSFLINLENRPWSSWGSKSGVRLGTLLRPFGIFSHDLKVDGQSLKGYRSRDFQDAWERYAGPVADGRGAENQSATT